MNKYKISFKSTMVVLATALMAGCSAFRGIDELDMERIVEDTAKVCPICGKKPRASRWVVDLGTIHGYRHKPQDDVEHPEGNEGKAYVYSVKCGKSCPIVRSLNGSQWHLRNAIYDWNRTVYPWEKARVYR